MLSFFVLSKDIVYSILEEDLFRNSWTNPNLKFKIVKHFGNMWNQRYYIIYEILIIVAVVLTVRNIAAQYWNSFSLLVTQFSITKHKQMEQKTKSNKANKKSERALPIIYSLIPSLNPGGVWQFQPFSYNSWILL